MNSNAARKLRFALVAMITAALILSVAALASPNKGKPAKPGKPVKAAKSASAAQYQYGKAKVTICHKGKSITVGAPAVKAHVRHGDSIGRCA